MILNHWPLMTILWMMKKLINLKFISQLKTEKILNYFLICNAKLTLTVFIIKEILKKENFMEIFSKKLMIMNSQEITTWEKEKLEN